MKKFILLSISLLLFSCNVNNSFDNTNLVSTNQKNGAKISLKIYTKPFTTSALSSNGSVAKSNFDVKSFKVWLCTNPQLPVSTKLANSEFDFDRVMSEDNFSWVDFFNVPPNTGTQAYYAVVSAYDDLIANVSRKNINKEFNYSTDGLQKLSVSNNSVIVKPNLTLSSLDSLKVTLLLSDWVGNVIETRITPQEGGIGMFGGV